MLAAMNKAGVAPEVECKETQVGRQQMYETGDISGQPHEKDQKC